MHANQAEKQAIQLQTQLIQSSDKNQPVNMTPHGPDITNHDDDMMDSPSRTSRDEADEIIRHYGADEDEMDTNDQGQADSCRTNRTINHIDDDEEDKEIYNQESDGEYPTQR